MPRANTTNLFTPVKQGYYIYKLKHRVDRWNAQYRCHQTKITRSALFYSYNDAYDWLIQFDPERTLCDLADPR